ncbi:hypothetical protein CL634_03775 [bacterium]|nr:hypothetical protein [bacterium]|tara:strand:+ start:864 stop:1310 length:447 start_codon:yes stop_codon:yes gene_type:complete
MSDLLSSSERAEIAKAFTSFFDTFKRQIEVHKEAKQEMADVDISFLLGYGEISNQTNYQYVPESSTFDAIVWFPSGGDQDTTLAREISAYIPEGEIRIKVKEDAKDYLTTGKVERVDVEGHSYALLGMDAKINTIIDGYYVFKLGEIK